ncbi:MAG: thiamine pyrophosphate-binding protein [Alphaproteobacteria bacterium]|nr:thiamine pyrophosphate-binding protein [Alphaproteobacteria bacterium]
MAKMTGARFLAETLHGYGATHVFFMPVFGIRALQEIEALGMTRVMVHSEKPAAYMADGYARIAGRAGVCMAQAVGAANLAAGLQDPFLAGSPVIAMTGRRGQAHQQRHSYQEVDHRGPFEAVTKYSNAITTVEQLPNALRQALRETVSGQPAPVHLDFDGIIGQDVLEAEADLEVIVEEQFTQVPPFRPEPDAASVAAVAQAIAGAGRPIIVAGGGVAHSGAGTELVALAEKLSIPVATSLNGKGTIPDFHPLCVGVVGGYSRWSANRAVCEADLVIYVGSSAGGMVTNEWTVPPEGTRTVQIDIDPRELGRSYPVIAAMQGDAKASLVKLLEASEANNGRSDWVAHAQDLVASWRAEVEPLMIADSEPVRTERLCAELSEHLPGDAILVSDTGHSGIWTGTMIDLKHPSQSYIRCAGSLGWAFPAAMGAKCAAPDRPVICFGGDGAMWYHLLEMETAVRCGINTVTVVNNNHSLNQEQGINEGIYGGRSKGSDDLWIFPEANFAKIADSMGGLGLTVERPGDFAGALEKAIESGRPALIDVKTDIESITPAPWQPPGSRATH